MAQWTNGLSFLSLNKTSSENKKSNVVLLFISEYYLLEPTVYSGHLNLSHQHIQGLHWKLEKTKSPLWLWTSYSEVVWQIVSVFMTLEYLLSYILKSLPISYTRFTDLQQLISSGNEVFNSAKVVISQYKTFHFKYKSCIQNLSQEKCRSICIKIA